MASSIQILVVNTLREVAHGIRVLGKCGEQFLHKIECFTLEFPGNLVLKEKGHSKPTELQLGSL